MACMGGDAIAWSLRRRKACLPCTRAKRRCDKALPACRRCVERESPCRYPSARPYARKAAPSDEADAAAPGRIDSLPSPPTMSPITPAHGDDAILDEDADVGLDLDLASPFDQQDLLADNSWFLRAESWAIDHGDTAPAEPSIHVSVWKSYVQGIRAWLHTWVQDGHCPFIHRQLFHRTGLPPCLQDAYATLAAYEAKNKNNEDIVMQLADDRADRLLAQQPLHSDAFMAVPCLSTTDHLARVLALFVYQMIGLLDGDVRARAHAEARIGTSQTWTRQLWESADLDASTGLAMVEENFTEGAANAAAPLTSAWRSWILAESVRRAWIVCNYTQAVYLTLRDGHCGCPGGIAFTARAGLWDAESAGAWARALRNQDPLFIRGGEVPGLLDSISVAGLDKFAVFVIGIMWDTDKVDAWVAKSSAVTGCFSLRDVMKV